MDILRDAESRLLADFNRYVDAVAELCGLTITQISREAVRDPAYIAGVRDGRRLSLDKYDAIIAWLDAQMAAQGKKLPKGGRKAAK